MYGSIVRCALPKPKHALHSRLNGIQTRIEAKIKHPRYSWKRRWTSGLYYRGCCQKPFRSSG